MIAKNLIFETDVTVSGGTADVDYHFDKAIDADAIGRTDLALRKAWIRRNRMILFMRLGAVLSRSGGSVKYWLCKTLVMINGSQLNYVRRMGFLAGMMSESRGLHWDRKRNRK